ncbi:MAG: flagellar hook-length control protein FliK [Candidatus Nitrotoga sp.]
MRLPGNIRSGDTIKLEVISTHPRITFSMVASTNPLSTPEHIGATARILSNLTELPLEKLIVKQLGNRAILDTGQQTPDTRLLAGALRDALGKSGLFYESHQAQWIRGERSMNQLLEEPQNVLTGKSLLPSPNNEQRAVSVAQTSSNMPVTSDSADDTSLPIAKELLSLVQQQLHTLEHHHLAWMGQVWPGQEIQWEIKGQPEHQPQQQDERQWSTEIELALPKLGNVHARLVFTESGLQLTLNAADTVTVDLFNRTLPQLRNSLADADIALTTALVEKS